MSLEYAEIEVFADVSLVHYIFYKICQIFMNISETKMIISLFSVYIMAKSIPIDLAISKKINSDFQFLSHF